MSDIYFVLSDPIRRKLLHMLGEKEMTQSELVASFTISQPAMIKHIKVLKNVGLINERRVGRFCYYSLNRSSFQQYSKIIRHDIEQIMDTKLTNLKSFVEKGRKD